MIETRFYDCEVKSLLNQDMCTKTIKQKLKESNFTIETLPSNTTSWMVLKLETNNKESLDKNLEILKKIIEEHGIKDTRVHIDSFIKFKNN